MVTGRGEEHPAFGVAGGRRAGLAKRVKLHSYSLGALALDFAHRERICISRAESGFAFRAPRAPLRWKSEFEFELRQASLAKEEAM